MYSTRILVKCLEESYSTMKSGDKQCWETEKQWNLKVLLKKFETINLVKLVLKQRIYWNLFAAFNVVFTLWITALLLAALLWLFVYFILFYSQLFYSQLYFVFAFRNWILYFYFVFAFYIWFSLHFVFAFHICILYLHSEQWHLFERAAAAAGV